MFCLPAILWIEPLSFFRGWKYTKYTASPEQYCEFAGGWTVAARSSKGLSCNFDQAKVLTSWSLNDLFYFLHCSGTRDQKPPKN